MTFWSCEQCDITWQIEKFMSFTRLRMLISGRIFRMKTLKPSSRENFYLWNLLVSLTLTNIQTNNPRKQKDQKKILSSTKLQLSPNILKFKKNRPSFFNKKQKLWVFLASFLIYFFSLTFIFIRRKVLFKSISL